MLKVRKNQSPPTPVGPCPISECMKMLSGAWAPHVIWNLQAGPRRFNELLNEIHGSSAKVLTTRLRELEKKGVITRHVRDTSPPSVEYALTDEGRRLVPAIEAIVSVGNSLCDRAGH